jgi:hypothetical protein
MAHIWMNHGTHVNKSWHVYEWVMSHMQIRHVTHTDKSCHTDKWNMSVRASNDTWHCKRAMSHLNESWHICKCCITYEWVMANMNASCHIWMARGTSWSCHILMSRRGDGTFAFHDWRQLWRSSSRRCAPQWRWYMDTKQKKSHVWVLPECNGLNSTHVKHVNEWFFLHCVGEGRPWNVVLHKICCRGWRLFKILFLFGPRALFILILRGKDKSCVKRDPETLWKTDPEILWKRDLQAFAAHDLYV